MRCQPDRRCSKFGMAIAAHSISTAGFDPLLYVFGADHTLRFVFFSHRSARVYRIAKGEEGSAQILKKPASLFSPALLSGWTPRRMLLKWLHPPADTRSFVFVETGAFLDRPSQERAPVPPFLHSHPWSVRDHGSLGVPRLGRDWPRTSVLTSFDPPEFHCFDLAWHGAPNARREHSCPVCREVQTSPKPFDYSNGLSGTLTHEPRTFQSVDPRANKITAIE